MKIFAGVLWKTAGKSSWVTCGKTGIVRRRCKLKRRIKSVLFNISNNKIEVEGRGQKGDNWGRVEEDLKDPGQVSCISPKIIICQNLSPKCVEKQNHHKNSNSHEKNNERILDRFLVSAPKWFSPTNFSPKLKSAWEEQWKDPGQVWCVTPQK